MLVSVKLFGALRQYLPDGSAYNTCTLTLTEGATVSELLAQLPIPENKSYLVILNDVKLDSSLYAKTAVSTADEVVLLPPIKGG